MTATTSHIRSPFELGAMRRLAESRLSSTEYQQARARLILETLDWVEGRATLAPWTQTPARVADADGLAAERDAAVSAEETARQSGGESRRPGVIGLTLSWVLCAPYTEPPLYG